MTIEEATYCDRNICLRNEYNGIGCDECEVTKSQDPNTVIGTGDGAYYRIKALQAQADGDLISRQTVKDCFKKWQPYMATRLHEFEKELLELPSVAIQNKVGHWIEGGYDDYKWVCSECGYPRYEYYEKPKAKFCEGCGSPMEIER